MIGIVPPPTPAKVMLLPGPGPQAMVTIRDLRDHILPRSKILLRPLSHVGSGLYRVDRGGTVRIEGEQNLTPLIEDAITARVRRRWVGHRLWPYGGMILQGTPLPLEVSAIEGCRVRALYRLRQPGISIPLYVDSFGTHYSRIATSTPILVLFEPSASHPRGMWSQRFGNEAHLWRTLSVKAPSRLAREAIEGDLRKGMTPDQVAWVLGWPPVQI